MAITYAKHEPSLATQLLLKREAKKTHELRRIVDSLVGVKVDPQQAKIGRPASGKVVVSLRLDPEVIEKFKATGKGWQGRINDVLRAVNL